MMTLMWIIQFLFVPVASPLCVGIIKKIKAKFQNRKGASIFQPYKDLWKLLHKDEVVSKDASWIFKCAPFIVFAVTLVAATGIPLFASFIKNTFTSDLLVLVYTLSVGTFFLALAGMDTGSAFGGFGASREMTVSALAEGGLIFSLLTIALVSGTTNLFAISGAGLSGQFHSFLSVALAFVGFFIVMLAETSRFPFDNPATHLELTMIHEAMILECSGKKLALMEWASANKLFIFAALGVNLFFPWGMARSPDANAIFVGVIAFVAKVFIFCAAIAIIESSMAKFRFFRLPDLLMISFILNVVAISLI
ncbi:MAG: NADH-quinone oxidoreductase subunit H [Deltaproteobacteria bacterium]|nr:NADH-quinone oxidoreductase subunit H [Deltaproteobacteria bacterium]